MFRVKIGLFILGAAFLISGCVKAMIDAKESCYARGGSWSEYDVIGKRIWPGRCVGAEMSHKEHCEQIREDIRQGSYRKLPDYCTKKRSSSKTPPPRLIIKAGESHFPKNANNPTAGETYLLTQLTPFLSEIIKSDDIIKTLALMGQCKIDKEDSKSWDYTYDFFTKSYTGSYYFTVGDPPRKRLILKQRNGKNLPFSKEELIDWMSSLGLDVFEWGGSYIYGVAGHTGGESIVIKNIIHNYPFYLESTLSYQLKSYGFDYDAPKIVGSYFALGWTNQSMARTVLSKKR